MPHNSQSHVSAVRLSWLSHQFKKNGTRSIVWVVVLRWNHWVTLYTTTVSWPSTPWAWMLISGIASNLEQVSHRIRLFAPIKSVGGRRWWFFKNEQTVMENMCAMFLELEGGAGRTPWREGQAQSWRRRALRGWRRSPCHFPRCNRKSDYRRNRDGTGCGHRSTRENRLAIQHSPWLRRRATPDANAHDLCQPISRRTWKMNFQQTSTITYKKKPDNKRAQRVPLSGQKAENC